MRLYLVPVDLSRWRFVAGECGPVVNVHKPASGHSPDDGECPRCGVNVVSGMIIETVAGIVLRCPAGGA